MSRPSLSNRSTRSSDVVPWWKTDLGEGEIASVSNSIRNRCINPGPVCRELERRLADYLGVRHVVTVSSGSTALLVSLIANGIRPGDEVVVPAVGFIAPANAALLAGCRVRLADVDSDRPLLDPESLAASLSDRAKAFVTIHLNGCASDLDGLRHVMGPNQVLIEDVAQAFTTRSRGAFVGTTSTASAFSMGITKLITTGEGGFVTTNDSEIYERLLRLRNHGVEAIANGRFNEWGFNFRLTDIAASIGLAQLDALQQRIDSVLNVYRYYKRHLADLDFLSLIPIDEEDGELPLWAPVVCEKRDLVIEELSRRGIQSRPFHPALNESDHLDVRGSFPNAEFFARNAMVLPSGTHQPESNLTRTVTALKEIGRELSLKNLPLATFE